MKSGIFLTLGIVGVLANQLFGIIADRMSDCFTIMIIGQGATLACFILIGPVPFIHIQP